jgi:putative ABC transport system permease protein
MLERLRTDLREVIHGFRASPGLVLVAALTLAAGTAMNVAMVGLVDRALLSPPRHIDDPGALFSVAFDRADEDGRTQRMTTTSYVAFKQLATDVPAFADAAAWVKGPANVVIDGDQASAETLLVSDGYFDLLGARPLMGRGMSAGPGRSGAVVVLSHGFWTAAFGRDPHVLGKRVRLRGMDFEVSAVMPQGFSGHAAAAVDAWFPITIAMSGTPGWDGAQRNVVSIVARLRDGETQAGATAQASAAVERRVALLPLAGAEVGTQERRIAYWLTGVAVLVFLIGLANAATLLMVRGARRRREAAVRAALGASHRRLIGQAIVEGGAIAGVAAAVALALSYWLDDSVRRVLLPGIVEHAGTTPRALFAAAAAGVIAAIVAAAAGIVSLPSRLQSEDLKGSGTSSRRPLQTGLLLLQTAVSVLLLAGAGMIGRSFMNLLQQDFGMRTSDLLLVDFEDGPNGVPDQDLLFTDAVTRVRALPGVAAATTVGALPFNGFHVPPISIPGRPQPQMDGQLPFLIAASPGLHDLLGITITQGRGFTASDQAGPPVVIVNETMARTVWPGESAVGRCIRIGFDPDFDPFDATGPPVPSAAVACREIVGVANDVRQRSVLPTGVEDRLMQYYVPATQVPPPPAGINPGPQIRGLLVRTSGSVQALAMPVRRAVLSGRADLPYVRVRPYAALFERQIRPWRVGTTLLAIFSLLAVGIASVGLYAAFAHTVTQRKRELAIRLAIGASPGAVRTMIFQEVAGVTCAGAFAGAMAAILAGRALRSFLFGVAPVDLTVLGAAAALMLAVAAIATILPARAAARVEPNALLRE